MQAIDYKDCFDEQEKDKIIEYYQSVYFLLIIIIPGKLKINRNIR